MFEELKTKYDSVFQSITEIYKCGKNDVSIMHPFNEGKSGDTVLLIYIKTAFSVSEIGYYILKIFKDPKKAEAESSKTISVGTDNNMEHISIPTIRYQGSNYYLYDVAGEELFHATSLDKTDEYALANRIESFSKYLLDEWNSKMTSFESTPYDLIRDWLGEELFNVDSILNKRLRNQINDELSDSFKYNDRVLPNPVYYLLSNS